LSPVVTSYQQQQEQQQQQASNNVSITYTLTLFVSFSVSLSRSLSHSVSKTPCALSFILATANCVVVGCSTYFAYEIALASFAPFLALKLWQLFACQHR